MPRIEIQVDLSDLIEMERAGIPIPMDAEEVKEVEELKPIGAPDFKLAKNPEFYAGIKNMYGKLEFYKKLLKNLQNVHTPYDLCLEILNKMNIQHGKTILVVSAVEFVAVLIDQFGIDKKDIFFLDEGRVDGKMGTIKKVVLMSELEITQEQILTVEGAKKMKFDYVVGNPPFSEGRADGKGGKSSNDLLYVKFFNMAFELSDNVAMIIPSTISKKMKAHNEFIKGVCTFYKEIEKEKFPGPTIDMWYLICLSGSEVCDIPFTIASKPKNNIKWGRGKIDTFTLKKQASALGYGDDFMGFTQRVNENDVIAYHKITQEAGLVEVFIPAELVPNNKRFPNSGYVVLIPQTMTDNGWMSTELVKCSGQSCFLNLKTVFFDNEDAAKRFQEFMKTDEFINEAKKVRAGFNQLTISGLQSIPFEFV